PSEFSAFAVGVVARVPVVGGAGSPVTAAWNCALVLVVESTSRGSGRAERAQLLLLEGKMPSPRLKFPVSVGPSETSAFWTSCQRVSLPMRFVDIDDEWSSRMYTFGFTRVAEVEPLAQMGALSGGMKMGLQASPG